MTGPTDSNRLGGVGSYLGRRADDPVNWQPWDEQSLETAREYDVPIFLSIGYDTGYWCRVMAEESFRDEAVAELLNAQFVPIAVDRDLRPELDLIYQTISRAVTGETGWPLSAWLTPEGKPFYVGTYFPSEHKDWAPGFPDLLEMIAQKWPTPEIREEIETRAEEWAGYAVEELETVPNTGATNRNTVERIADLAVRTADHEYGGWGTGAKFPEPARIELLFVAGSEDHRRVAIRTLDAMADGTLHDHVGGGFFRHCADREWRTPHFEKTVYDNAEIARAFLSGYHSTGEQRYADVARRTFEFLDCDLSRTDGAFSAGIGEIGPGSDNRAERESADNNPTRSYYAWTAGEIEETVDDPTSTALLRDRYGIENGGGDGSVPRIATSIEELAEEYDRPTETVLDQLRRGRERLRDARRRRSRSPSRDQRMFAGWNGLAVSAFAEGALVLDDGALAERATTALDVVQDRLWDGERLTGRYVDDSHSRGVAYLDDYAFLGTGALRCYEATGDDAYREFAFDVGRTLLEKFLSDDRLSFVPTDRDGTLIADPQPTRDRTVPSSISVAVDLLVCLGRADGDAGFDDIAERIFGTYEPRLETDLLQHHALALAGRRIAAGSTTLSIGSGAHPGS